MTREIRSEVRPHRNGSDPGAASSVGNAEGFVKIEVADISTEMSRSSDANKGIEVGAIEVDLTASIVNRSADLADCFLENAMSGGVGDHERRKRLCVLGDFRSEIVNIDVSVFVAGNDNDSHANHGGAGGVGAVR